MPENKRQKLKECQKEYQKRYQEAKTSKHNNE